MSKLNIAIIADRPLIAYGIVHFIQSKNPDAKTALFFSLNEFSKQIVQEVNVIIIDPGLLNPPEKVSMEKLYAKNKSAKFLALTEHPLKENISPFFDAIISPDSSDEKINGELAKTFNSLKNKSVSNSSANLISDREKEVLRGVALGLTNKEISDNLHISSHTVITHRKNISAKIGIKTIAGLAVYAVLNGIITPEEMDS